jgi:hypothetical protein
MDITLLHPIGEGCQDLVKSGMMISQKIGVHKVLMII